MVFTDSKNASGRMERYGSDELPWESDGDKNKTNECMQEFTWDSTDVKITARTDQQKKDYPCADTADLTADDISVSTASWSVKTVYTDPATYTTATSAE